MWSAKRSEGWARSYMTWAERKTSWKLSQNWHQRLHRLRSSTFCINVSSFFFCSFFFFKHFLNQQHAARLSFQTATVNFHNYRELPSVMLISVNMSHGFKPKDYSLVLTDAFLPLPFFAMPSLAGGRLFSRILFYSCWIEKDRWEKKKNSSVPLWEAKESRCCVSFSSRLLSWWDDIRSPCTPPDTASGVWWLVRHNEEAVISSSSRRHYWFIFGTCFCFVG